MISVVASFFMHKIIIFSFVGVDISAGFNGWSLKTLKGVVSEAGAHLERLNSELSEDGLYHFLLVYLLLCTGSCWLKRRS